MPRYLCSLSIALATLSFVVAKPIHSWSHFVNSAVERRQNIAGGSSSYAIGTPNNGVQPRLEIRDLQTNPDAWNVFLLGLKRWQEVDPTDELSYYKVMGIHGRQQMWDGVQQATGGSFGYCTHGSNIFITWHRPYCQLIEQCLLDNAMKAVAEYPNDDRKNRYNQVLETLRVPYYDWAKNIENGEQILPNFFQRSTVNIAFPEGNRTVENPLFSYQFPNSSREDFKDPNAPWWAEYPMTVRIPTSKDANAASRNDVVESELNKIASNVRERVNNILTLETNFANVSSYITDGDSLESVHGLIHVTIGGDGGHMQDVPMSSYDPIFIFHHMQIDHIAAMWQAGHPDSYVQPENQTYATFSRPAGALVDETSALFPFHKDTQGTFWNSQDVRDTKVFGYTYADIPDDPAMLKQTINALYGNTQSPKQKRESYENRIYTANIKAPKLALSGSYYIYVFVGNAPLDDIDPLCWNDGNPDFAGSSAVFASSSMSQHGANKTTFVQTAVPLTWTLKEQIADGKLANLSVETVTAYLKEKLQWRVRSIDNHNVPLYKVAGLELSIVTAEVTPGDNATAFPVAGGYETVLKQVAVASVGEAAKNSC